MAADLARLKREIISALSHVEAEEGLYFNNLIVVHEDEERPPVDGTQEDVLAALREMLKEGTVVAEDHGDAVIFRLRNN